MSDVCCISYRQLVWPCLLHLVLTRTPSACVCAPTCRCVSPGQPDVPARDEHWRDPAQQQRGGAREGVAEPHARPRAHDGGAAGPRGVAHRAHHLQRDGFTGSSAEQRARGVQEGRRRAGWWGWRQCRATQPAAGASSVRPCAGVVHVGQRRRRGGCRHAWRGATNTSPAADVDAAARCHSIAGAAATAAAVAVAATTAAALWGTPCRCRWHCADTHSRRVVVNTAAQQHPCCCTGRRWRNDCTIVNDCSVDVADPAATATTS
jgi:hypothetical protein